MGELVLLVQPTDDALDDELRRSIATSLRSALSPRHVPDVIVGVSGIPRTLTGKKLELPVKKILQGAEVTSVVSREALANPEVLDDVLLAAERRR